MLKRILTLFLLIALLIPLSVFAQQGVGFSTVEVDLWPEFDRSSMLVIYRMTLSPQVTLPAEVRLRVPASIGTPNAVAAAHPDGSLVNIPYNQEQAGEWSWVVFQATTPDIQIEYYDPDLVKDGTARHYKYTWPGDHAVDAFVVDVQQPVGATEMRIKPGMVNARSGTDGMMYYTLDVGALSPDQAFEITVDYQKSEDRLSSDGLPVEPSGPLDDSASGRKSMTSALPWMLGLLGVLLIAGGGLWYYQSGREVPQPSRKRGQRHKASARSENGEAAAGEHIYCHQCGKRATPGDRFCRACGTQLRLG